MSNEKIYVYRVRWAMPDGWVEPDEHPYDDWSYHGRFHWPSRRNYFTPKTAQSVVDDLKGYGLDAWVEKSEPVTFSETERIEVEIGRIEVEKKLRILNAEAEQSMLQNLAALQ